MRRPARRWPLKILTGILVVGWEEKLWDKVAGREKMGLIAPETEVERGGVLGLVERRGEEMRGVEISQEGKLTGRGTGRMKGVVIGEGGIRGVEIEGAEIRGVMIVEEEIKGVGIEEEVI